MKTQIPRKHRKPGKLHHQLLFWLHFLLKKKTIKKVVWLDSLQEDENTPVQITVIAPEAKTTVFLPAKLFDKTPQPVETLRPAINLYRFQHQRLPGSGAFLRDSSRVYIERVAQAPQEGMAFDTDEILFNRRGRARIDSRPKGTEATLKLGIHLLTHKHNNYYHWLIETLPKIFWIQQLKENRKDLDPSLCEASLILSNSIKTIPSFQKSLQAIINPEKTPCVFLPETDTLACDELFYLTSPNLVVYHRSTPNISPMDAYFDWPLLNELRTHLLKLSRAHPPKRAIPKRVYLARSTKRRSHNQDELIQTMKPMGFEDVYLEKWDFWDQVALFNQADIIIGASGATWANLLFAKPGLKAVSWLPENVNAFSAYSSLAQAMGCKMSFLHPKPTQPNQLHSEYRLAPQELVAHVIIRLDELEGVAQNGVSLFGGTPPKSNPK